MSEQALWNELVDRHYAQIFAFCCHYLGRRDEAEDAVQSTFMKAFTGYNRLRDRSKEKAWIYSIARNCCIDRTRFWKRTIVGLPKLAEPRKIFEGEISLSIQKVLSNLPRMQREVFILRHWHDFSTDETAGLLGIQSGTVKTHLKRAVDRMKLELA
jgi:RNA polymerase sigma-70 factor (ECF subfamily)